MEASRLVSLVALTANSALALVQRNTQGSVDILIRNAQSHINENTPSIPSISSTNSFPLLKRSLSWSSSLALSSSNEDDIPTSTDWKITDMMESVRNRFNVGDYYVWLYEDADGQPTSWEKYSVSAICDDLVVINMSTKFSEGEDYFTHHRMTVNLTDNLNAVDDRNDWRLKKFECRNVDENGKMGEWRQFGNGDNVQAFEEKFDVFSMGRPSNEYLGETSREQKKTDVVVDRQSLVRTERHDHTEAWFVPPSNEELSGVAVLKHFKEHKFSLIESGRQGEDPRTIDIQRI